MPLFSRPAFLAAATLLFACLSVVGQEEAERDPGPVLEYSRDPDTVVILMDMRGAFKADDIPLVRIYGDGRVLVHLSRQGDYEMYLSQQEVEGWLYYLYESGIMAFDSQTMKRRKLQIVHERWLEAQARGEGLTGRTSVDLGPTIIELNLKAFKPEESSAERIDNYKHRVVWGDIRLDAEEFPEILELALLAEVQEAFLALAKHPDLLRIPDE